MPNRNCFDMEMLLTEVYLDLLSGELTKMEQLRLLGSMILFSRIIRVQALMFTGM